MKSSLAMSRDLHLSSKRMTTDCTMPHTQPVSTSMLIQSSSRTPTRLWLTLSSLATSGSNTTTRPFASTTLSPQGSILVSITRPVSNMKSSFLTAWTGTESFSTTALSLFIPTASLPAPPDMHTMSPLLHLLPTTTVTNKHLAQSVQEEV